MGELLQRKIKTRHPYPQMYAKVVIDSGEKIFISVAPEGVRVFEMGSKGIFPKKTIWKAKRFDRVMLWVTREMLLSKPKRDIIDIFVDEIINCTSLNHVRMKLDERNI